MKDQYDEVMQDYLAIPNDNLLKSFRQRAGLPAPGEDMGGWYEDGLFNIFGQVLSGLARFYAGSGDPAVKEKADTLIHEWALCIRDDGFFFNNSDSKSAHYVYEKLVGGLVDNFIYCRNEQARETLGVITAWAMEKLPRNHHGWNAEWYTLSENLYRAYLATGEEKYREFAEVWEYPEYWDHFVDRTNIFSHYPAWFGENPSYHAYSHVNTLSGAAMAYAVKGEPYYLQVIEGAYDTMRSAPQIFATGGYGPSERLMTRRELIDSLSNVWEYKHFETQCGSWAVFKLSKYLIALTGSGHYGDWAEQLILNGIGASVPASEGRVMYCSDYHSGGGFKTNIDDPWSCCAGTRPMAIADYADLIYFHDADSLHINLFLPSSVSWQRGENRIMITQATDFPDSNSTELHVSLPQPESFGLRVRIPGWLAEPIKAELNGEAVDLECLNGWGGIEREWRDGDRLCVILPMDFEVSRIDHRSIHPAAILYGPVALAAASQGTNPGDKIVLHALRDSLLPVPGKPLHFHVRDTPALVFKPFYAFAEREQYYMYLDPAWSNRVSPHLFRFHGKWLWGGSSEVGAWAEGEFEGSALRWEFRRGPNAGMLEVAIDGRVVEVADQYGPPFEEGAREWTDLGPGRHTIRFALLEEKNPDATNHAVNIGSFYLPEPVAPRED